MRGFKWSSRQKKAQSVYVGNNNDNNESSEDLRSINSNSSVKRKSAMLLANKFNRSTDNVSDQHHHGNKHHEHAVKAQHSSAPKESRKSMAPAVPIPPQVQHHNQQQPQQQQQQQQQQLQPTNNKPKSSTVGDHVVTINEDNYDTTLFKIGWLNKSSGQYHSKVAHNSVSDDNGMGGKYESSHNNNTNNTDNNNTLHNNNNNNTTTNPNKSNLSNDNEKRGDNDHNKSKDPMHGSNESTTTILVPEYKLYRAQLKGALLTFYKSGLHSNIKYFDPVPEGISPKASSSNLSGTTKRSSTSLSSANTDNAAILNNLKNESVKRTLQQEASGVETKTELRHCSEIYPHPELKLDENKEKIINGTTESICHAVLFRNASSRRIINMILSLPLIDRFEIVLQIFINYSNHFAEIKTETSVFNTLIVERLSLLVRTVIDILPGLILSEKIYQKLITITTIIKNEKLRNLLQEKNYKLSKITSFRKSLNVTMRNDTQIYDTKSKCLTNVNYFLEKVDYKIFATTLHSINLDFDKTWSPRFDYSLIYDSESMDAATINNCSIQTLNPLVFNNRKKLHPLGKLISIHLFGNNETDEMKKSEIIIKWIKIGCKFEKLGDMVSWLAISTVICSLPILRLSKIWSFIDEIYLKILFKDWIPTVLQLERRQFSVRSTGNVFILAPPNLSDPFIKNNVISYFNDLSISPDKLPADSKLKYLDKKITRTKNAFHKWEQRLAELKSSSENENDELIANIDTDVDQEVKSLFYNFWNQYLEEKKYNFEHMMKLSIKLHPPAIDLKAYSIIGSKRSSLLTGSYIPILFNELLSSYSLFTRKSLIGASGTLATSHSSMVVGSGAHSRLPPPRSSARVAKTLSISEAVNVVRSDSMTDLQGIVSSDSIANGLKSSSLTSLSSQKTDGNQVTGIDDIDDPMIKEMSTKSTNKLRLTKSIRDVFNIDTNLFTVSDDLIFKSINENEVLSRPASLVIESTKRFSQLSVSTENTVNTNNTSHNNSNSLTLQDFNKDQNGSLVLSKSIESLDFFKSSSKLPETLNENHIIKIVLKSASLNKIFDLLVLTINIFSKLLDHKQLENYYRDKKLKSEKFGTNHAAENLSKVQRLPRSPSLAHVSSVDQASTDIGMLDYALVKLSMDNTLFTETFFSTYKSFTTTLSVIENLAKRFLKAKECACSIQDLLVQSSSSSLDKKVSKFPNWDFKITPDKTVNYLYMMMIHLGILEVIFYMTRYHYNDFVDDLDCSTAFLDFFEIIEQEVMLNWPARISSINKSKCLPSDQVNEIENYNKRLVEYCNKIKITFQKQVYKPVGTELSQREALKGILKFKKCSYLELSESLTDGTCLTDSMTSEFLRLNYRDYEKISSWLISLDCFITKKAKLVSKAEWFTVHQQLEQLSASSATALFNYSTHKDYIKLLSSGSLQLDELEISNVFDWISTLKQGNSLFIDTLPTAIKLLIKLHISLSKFFTFMISNTENSLENRVDVCCVVLQMLNFTRWKNSSLDLFESETTVTSSNNKLSPHIPSFIETAISNAILAPESRYYEVAWRSAYTIMQPKSHNASLRSIHSILSNIDDKHIKCFASLQFESLSKIRNLCPCPGWSISRLLEISQFVPNMSIENSKLINFDKRRFVFNIVSNVYDLIPNSYGSDILNGNSNFGNILYKDYTNEDPSYRIMAKTKAISESKAKNFQSSGLFNEIIINEVDKYKREHKKKSVLSNQEVEKEKMDRLHTVIPKNKRNSVIIPGGYQMTKAASFSSTIPTSNSNSKLKRSSASSTQVRHSLSSSSSHTGVSKKLGGFLKSPFSGFSSSSTSINSMLKHDVTPDGSVPSNSLPIIDVSGLNDGKPIVTIKTFEIKSIVPLVNRTNSAYSFAFKVVLENGSDYLVQATNASDLNEWVLMIKVSKRYSFCSKKYKGKTHNKIFGIPLEDVCEREGTMVPTIVTKLIDEIELRGLDEVGLYRIPGSAGSINALKAAFDEEGAVNNTFSLEDDKWFEINAIAGCFKMYLRELPETLFTNERISQFVKLAVEYKSSIHTEAEYIFKMTELLKQLPTSYYFTMKRIVFHLNKIHQHVGHNKMDASNLAIVFSMSFIDQEDLASMGTTLGAIQTILLHYIKSPQTFFVN